MDDANLPDGEPGFGMGFRVTVGAAALLSGIALLLWASGFSEVWKYLPALFCFALFGIFALPKPIAVLCGYVVASTILALCLWYLYLGVTGKQPLLAAVHIGFVYGLPSLAYILYRQLPGRTRRDT